jgi:hypothetical protein
MGAYKQLLAQDIIVTPFEVNKGFTFNGAAQLTGSNVYIDRFLGKNITSSIGVDSTLFNSGSDPKTGQVTSQYQRLIYNSIKELYYSNYLSSSYSSPISRATLIPGQDEEGNRLVGGTYAPSFYNYLQTTLSYPHYFPTASNSTIGVLAIPSKLFGDQIQPNTLRYTSDNDYLALVYQSRVIADGGTCEAIGCVISAMSYPTTYYDDGEGNLLLDNTLVGNVVYQHGMIVLTNDTSDNIVNFITSSNTTCSFSSSYSLYETQYKCTIRENEFNFSQNPTLLSGSSNDTIYNFATSSYFAPYITTVGLYDDNQNLVAVGKLSQPLPSSRTTDMTIYVNIDR